MRTLILATVMLALPLAACGGQGGGFDSPEAVSKAVITAFAAQDAAGIKALFPSDEVLKGAMKCTDDKEVTEQLERMAKERDKLVKESAEAKDAKFEYVGMEDRNKDKTLKAGETLKGTCTATKDMVQKRVRLKFKVTVGDKSEDEGEGIKLLQIDGKWYLVDF